MKSFCGSGLYCSTSIGPRVSVACSSALEIDAGSRTSAVKPCAWTPSFPSSSASASRRPWLREMRATANPSAPNRRATAAPRPDPAPIIAIVVIGGARRPGAVVFRLSAVWTTATGIAILRWVEVFSLRQMCRVCRDCGPERGVSSATRRGGARMALKAMQEPPEGTGTSSGVTCEPLMRCRLVAL